MVKTMTRKNRVKEKSIFPKILEKAVTTYNKYREPEAKARILKFTGEKVVVVFEGSFCRTCGVNDWVEDFKYILQDLGVDTELEEIKEPANPYEDYRVGVFRIYGKVESIDR